MSTPISASTPRVLPALPSLPEQAENLIELGIPALVGLNPVQVRAIATTNPAQQAPPATAGSSTSPEPGAPAAAAAAANSPAASHAPTAPGAPALPRQENDALPPLLVLPGAPIQSLAPLMVREGKPGFVVEDMTDVEEFIPIDGLDVPAQPYLLHGIDRGDALRNASPEEAQAQFTSDGRTALTLAEGIYWVLAQPEALAPNYCFMTIASRRPKARGGLDARTPALWISGGTGRDGKPRRGAAKVGWCWARNRHTWLGFASAAARTPVPAC